MNDTQNAETNPVDNEVAGFSPETEWDVIRRKRESVGSILFRALDAYMLDVFVTRAEVRAAFNTVYLRVGRREYEIDIWENDRKNEDNAACFCETVEFDETVLERLPAGNAIERLLTKRTESRRAFTGVALKGLLVRAIREYHWCILDVRSEVAVDRSAHDRSLVVRRGEEEFKLVFSRTR